MYFIFLPTAGLSISTVFVEGASAGAGGARAESEDDRMKASDRISHGIFLRFGGSPTDAADLILTFSPREKVPRRGG